MRTVLVFVHATAGVVGLGAGVATIIPPRPGNRWASVRKVYTGCIGVLLVALAALIAVDWPELDPGSKVAFLALAGLGVAMAWRLALAGRLARARPAGWAGHYVDHVYFTYISLWVGFVVLPALSLPLPQLTVPVCALAVLGVGHLVLKRARPRLVGSTEAQASG